MPVQCLVEHGLVTEVGGGVEVEVDDRAVVQPQPGGLRYEGMLQLAQVHVVKRVGVGRHGRALRHDVESGEEAETGIEGVVSDVGVAFGAEQFESQEGQQVAGGRNDLRAR